MIRAMLRISFVAVGVAIAVWLLPASLHIVNWPPSGPVRIAWFAPLRTLWWCLAAAAAIVAGIAAVGARFGPQAPRQIASLAAPFALLWLWIVPYLPWLPDRAPLLLVLAGPLRWSCVCCALLAALWRAASAAGWRWREASLPGRGAVFVITFAVYLGFGLWSAAAVGPGGDEPHYLVIAQSLLLDHDLAIENNHTRGDYREYFNGPLRPDYLQRGLNGVIYSIHAPGLPALVAPAYALAGYRGAVVLICLFSALAAIAIFELAEPLAGRGAAWLTVAAVCLAVPFVPHSWMIYPEMPGVLIVAWAVLWLYRRPQPERPLPWIGRGAMLALLPWLHTKFSVLMVLLAMFLALRLWPRIKTIAAFAAPLAVSTSLWLYFFFRIYGVFDPQAPYGDSARTQMFISNIPRGLLGLLFDQKFGLLPYSPVYLIAALGGWTMLRRSDRRLFGAALMATFIAFLATTTRYYMWWGGSSAPARFLVPTLPLLAPLVAVGFRELRGPAARAVAACLLIVTLSVALAGVAWPRRFMLFSAPHGIAQLVDAMQAGSPLAWTLPTFTEEPMAPPLTQLASWLAAAAAGLVVLSITNRLTRGGATFRTVASGAVTFFLAAALLAGEPSAEGRRATLNRGRLDLLAADDGQRLRPYDYSHGVRSDERRVLAMATLSASRAAGELSENPEQVGGPFELPPGRFIARVWFAGTVGAGRAFVALPNGSRIAHSAGALSNPTHVPFSVPVGVAVSIALSDEALARAVSRVEIVPEAIVPRSARPDVEVHALETVDGRPGAFIVYGDSNTYPENGVFWTRATSAGTVYVAPADASTLVLTLHTGPLSSRIRLRVDGQERTIDFQAEDTRVIEIPLSPSRGLVPVTVEASQQFRPSERDPGSNDSRWLGCQVRIGLK